MKNPEEKRISPHQAFPWWATACVNVQVTYKYCYKAETSNTRSQTICHLLLKNNALIISKWEENIKNSTFHSALILWKALHTAFVHGGNPREWVKAHQMTQCNKSTFRQLHDFLFCFKHRRVAANYFYLLLESKEMELSERSGSHSSAGS